MGVGWQHGNVGKSLQVDQRIAVGVMEGAIDALAAGLWWRVEKARKGGQLSERFIDTYFCDGWLWIAVRQLSSRPTSV